MYLWLKSGMLLCELANSIQAGSVTEMPLPPPANASNARRNAHYTENVGKYLEACRKIGVPEHDLFRSVDLVEGKDMRSVVRNLHSLGRVAQTLDGYDKPTLGARLASKNTRHFSERQLAEARAIPTRLRQEQAAKGAMVREGSENESVPR